MFPNAASRVAFGMEMRKMHCETKEKFGCFWSESQLRFPGHSTRCTPETCWSNHGQYLTKNACSRDSWSLAACRSLWGQLAGLVGPFLSTIHFTCLLMVSCRAGIRVDEWPCWPAVIPAVSQAIPCSYVEEFYPQLGVTVSG